MWTRGDGDASFFWTCQHSVQVWKELCSELGAAVENPPCQITSQSAVVSWLLGWFAGAAEEEKEVMIQAVYSLWLARNEAREEKRMAPPHEIAKEVKRHTEEWRMAHEKSRSAPSRW